MQCVAYANQCFSSSVKGNGCDWYNNTATTQVTLRSGCVACWKGGSNSYGHVGVVESYDSKSKTMTYSDANYNGDGKVITRKGITEAAMKKLFGSTYTFQGYVIPD